MKRIRKDAGMSVAGLAMRMGRSITAIRRMEAGTLAISSAAEAWLKQLDQFLWRHPPIGRRVRYTYDLHRRALYANEMVSIPDAVAENPAAWVDRPFPILRQGQRGTRAVIDHLRADGSLVLKSP